MKKRDGSKFVFPITKAILEHDIDPQSYYCRRCGAAASEIKATFRECNHGDNIIAISHILAHKRMNDFLKQVNDLLEKV